MAILNERRDKQFRDYRICALNADLYKDEDTKNRILRLQEVERFVCGGHLFGLPYVLYYQNKTFGKKVTSLKRCYGVDDKDIEFINAKFGTEIRDPTSEEFELYKKFKIRDLDPEKYRGRARESILRLQRFEKKNISNDADYGLPFFLVCKNKGEGLKLNTLKKRYGLHDDDFLFLNTKFGVVFEEHGKIFSWSFEEAQEVFYTEQTPEEKIERFKKYRLSDIDEERFESPSRSASIIRLKEKEREMCNGYDFGLPYFLEKK